MAEVAACIGALSPALTEIELPGPVGERNLYALRPRGTLLLRPSTRHGLFHLIAAALATGNSLAIDAEDALTRLADRLPSLVRDRIKPDGTDCSTVLVEGEETEILDTLKEMAQRAGALIPVHAAHPAHMLAAGAYCPLWLIEEVSTSINTTAAGGNASLIAIA